MKTTTSFESLLKNDLYQVFLCSSPAHIPFSLWTHPWIVINKKGHLARYEVHYTPNRSKPELGHIHINDLPFFDGIEVFPFLSHPRWRPTLLGHLEGGEDSSAQHMCQFVEESIRTYKNKDIYFIFGPNSNTYVQWILNHFPEFEGSLERNILGKKNRE